MRDPGGWAWAWSVLLTELESWEWHGSRPPDVFAPYIQQAIATCGPVPDDMADRVRKLLGEV